MRRASKADLSGIIVGLFLAIGGVFVFLFPREMIVEHPGGGKAPATHEHVTPARARAYGLASLTMGTALVVLVVYGVSAKDNE
jgi:hypothetical protein